MTGGGPGRVSSLLVSFVILEKGEILFALYSGLFKKSMITADAV